MSKAPPYFPFYPDDWIGGTRHLTALEKVCYLELLMYQWANGAIPEKPVTRMNLCGISDVGQWGLVWDNLRDKFEPDNDGHLLNPRMAREREKAIRAYTRSVENGRKGGRPKNLGVSSRLTQTKGNQNQNQNHRKEKKQKKEAASAAGAAPLPFSSREFGEAWETFSQMRREIRKPLSPTASKMALKRLQAMGEARAVIALEYTTSNQWQGIREPEAGQWRPMPQPRSSKPKPPTESEMRRALNKRHKPREVSTWDAARVALEYRQLSTT